MNLQLTAWLCLGLLCMEVPTANPYSTGAPQETCRTMLPGHGSQSTLGYSITTSNTIFNATSTIQVTVNGTYKGIIMQARQTSCSDPIGTWSALPINTTLLMCLVEGDTVTHSIDTSKTNSVFTWIPPKDKAPSSVEFVATVALNKDSWMLQVKSPSVTAKGYNANTACGAGAGPTFRSHASIAWLLPLGVVLMVARG